MDGNSPKCALRKTMKALRREVTPEYRASYSSLVCERILERDDVRRAVERRGVFAAYLASQQEIDLSCLIQRLWAAGCRVVVPAWRDGTYRLADYSPETRLKQGPMGILEPEAQEDGADLAGECEIDVWIVPGLAFSRSGARLGYGGGWYDRFLSEASSGAIAVGVAYPFQIVNALPLERHDIPLTDVVEASSG